MPDLATIEAPALPRERVTLIGKLASRFGVEPARLMTTLKQTAFRQQDGEPTNEEMMSLLVVADQYGLNPFTKELFAFRDKRSGGIIPIVSIDGWSRIINEHPQYDGCEFEDGPEKEPNGTPTWIACAIFRKDRGHATRIRERLVECQRTGSIAWQQTPARMLRHRAFMQCGRVAFGFSGIYDRDEAERIIDNSRDNSRIYEHEPPTIPAAIAHINEQVAPRRQARDDDEPATVTYAAVADALRAASTPDEVDLAADLIRGVANEQQRAELDVEARAKRTRLIAEELQSGNVR